MNRDAHYTPRMIKRALISGLPSAGVHVADLHSVPIPVARYVTHAMGVDGGLHVRLSPFDNRVVDVLFFDNRGLDLSPAVRRKIERVFFQEDFRRVYLDDIARIFDPPQVLQHYLSAFRNSLDMDVLREAGSETRLVVDYGNSSGAGVLPAILDELNCDVIALNATVDDRRLYHSAQEFEQSMKLLEAVVPAVGAHFGVRLDTGGERFYLVDNLGRRIDGMKSLVLMIALALDAKDSGNIAVPVSAPSVVDVLAQRYNRTVTRTKLDLAALMDICAEQDILIGGDGSGSILFPQFYPISDGLFTIVKLMELLVREGVSLSSYLDQLPPYHLSRIRASCRWESKGRVMRLLNEQYAERILDRSDGVKIGLGGGEWVLIVPDADGPYFYIYAEGDSDEQSQVLAEKYAGLVVSLQ